MRRKLTITLFTSLLLFSFWQLTVNVSAQEAFTLAKILTALQTNGKTAETNTLAKRNIYITKKVELYGVTFRLTPDFEKELRNAGATTALIAAIRANGPSVTPTPTQRTTSTAPSAKFERIWIDYDVTEGGVKGMRIHTKLTVYNMKNVPSYLAIYFETSAGKRLRDNNKSYDSSSGEVALYRELQIDYNPGVYNDLTAFMPYDELDLAPGEYNLRMDVDLIYKAGGLIQHLAFENFSYTKPESERNSSEVTAKVNRTWVDYNVTEGGVKGMRIHVNFEVTGLKGVSSLLVARVRKSNGDYLLSSGNYANGDGELETTFSMKPGFETTVFKDADMFLPYNEIRVSKGVWNLELDIDLNYDSGELIQHLTFEKFQFTQP